MAKSEALPWKSIAQNLTHSPKLGLLQKIFQKIQRKTAQQAQRQNPEALSSSLFFMETGPHQQISHGSFTHVTVLPQESVKLLQAGPGKCVVDCTLGGGGHSELLLETGAKVIGIDQDDSALAAAKARLARFGDQFIPVKGNFGQIQSLLTSIGIQQVDGILADLGVSSHQLDTAERGFSFQQDGPLDMRMDPSSGQPSAADVVNTWPDYELIKIFRELGEEPLARRVAAAIIERRKKSPFSRTLDLAQCVATVVHKTGRKHPATRTFQAIRMAVNDELGSLQRLLDQSIELLPAGGKLALITFHSLEDRMVKEFLRKHSKAEIDRPEWPEPRPNPDYHFRLMSRKAISPSDEELKINPRSRSSKLRGAERIAQP